MKIFFGWLLALLSAVTFLGGVILLSVDTTNFDNILSGLNQIALGCCFTLWSRALLKKKKSSEQKELTVKDKIIVYILAPIIALSIGVISEIFFIQGIGFFITIMCVIIMTQTIPHLCQQQEDLKSDFFEKVENNTPIVEHTSVKPIPTTSKLFNIFKRIGIALAVIALLVGAVVLGVEYRNDLIDEKERNEELQRINRLVSDIESEDSDTKFRASIEILKDFHLLGSIGESKVLGALRDLAEDGDCDAPFILGLWYDCYDFEGEKFFTDTGSNSYYGRTYRYRIDKNRASYWYLQAAKRGNCNAQYYLAIAYFNGEGVSKDIEKAIYWWTQSSNSGHSSAQYALGCRHSDGVGVTKDISIARHYWQLAAAQGHSEAQKALETIYIGDDEIKQ